MHPLSLLAIWILACGCIPLGEDARLSRLAREEWARVGAPDRFADAPVTGARCIGFPGVLGWAGITVYVPWPWSECDWITRVIVRYEASKAAYQLHGYDRDGTLRWYGPLLFLDGLFHGPPSELHSWYRVLFPGPIQYGRIDYGPPPDGWTYPEWQKMCADVARKAAE